MRINIPAFLHLFFLILSITFKSTDSSLVFPYPKYQLEMFFGYIGTIFFPDQCRVTVLRLSEITDDA